MDSSVHATAVDAGSIVDLPVESFDKVMAVNVRGIFLGLKSAIPALRERGKGSIVVAKAGTLQRQAPAWRERNS
jgi:NAD(P)-dependent dehydrogenase (short-subunit alcohol dehydrogenase family)